MQNIWSRRTETGLTGDEFRDQVQLHLARHIGEAHVAFSDQDGWAGRSKEPGPPVDVLVAPPEGERRFAYVATFGSSLKRSGDPMARGGRKRMEFVLAAPQTGEPEADLAMLNMAANTARQFAKLVHLQDVRVQAGETVQFAPAPRPMFEGSRQMAFAFLRPRLPAEGFDTLRLRDDVRVEFWGLVPIYASEAEAARARGPGYLDKALIAGGVTEMLDAARQPVVKRGFLAVIRDLFSRRK